MKEFLFIFRVDHSRMKELSPQELQNVAESAKKWVAGIVSQNKLADKGSRLVPDSGKVLKNKDIITDGPYVETKEAVNGYLVIKTDTIEEAAELAKGNPIFTFNIGGSIEVREISKI